MKCEMKRKSLFCIDSILLIHPLFEIEALNAFNDANVFYCSNRSDLTKSIYFKKNRNKKNGSMKNAIAQLERLKYAVILSGKYKKKLVSSYHSHYEHKKRVDEEIEC